MARLLLGQNPRIMSSSAIRRIGVLVSGRGSNLQALLAADFSPAHIVVVVSDKEKAGALDHARHAGVEAVFLSPKAHEDRVAFDAAVTEKLLEHHVDFVCLAGYMRLVTTEFVAAWRDRMINIHPSLLPIFKGLRAQSQALAAGVRLAGATVHIVTEECDSGAILGQAVVPVLPSDDEVTLSARILTVEHRLYPLVVRGLVKKQITIEKGQVRYQKATVDGEGIRLLSVGTEVFL